MATLSIEDDSDNENSLFIIDDNKEIPITNAGVFALKIEYVSSVHKNVSGHIIFNCCYP